MTTMNGKICSGHADIDSAINSLIETLSTGKNGVKCEVVAYSISPSDFVREKCVCGHVLAKKNYDGSFVTWFFNGTNTVWGHYDMTEEEGKKDFESRALEDGEVIFW